MPLSGILERSIGARATCALGCAIFTLSVLLTSFSLNWSYYAVLITYGVTLGVGIGIAYSVCIACAVRCFPERKGTVSGVIVFGFGISALLFNLVQTRLVNPDNLSPDATGDSAAGERYFSQPEVLQRLPTCLQILAAIYAVLQLLGVLLLGGSQVAEADEQRALLRDVNTDRKPSEVCRSRLFWLLYVVFLCNQITVNFIGSLYKAFGLTFIHDDLFLALIGSLSSVFNATSRVFWGFFADRTSARFTLFLLACLNAMLLFTVYSCSVTGQVTYLIWICLIYFIFPGVFSVCPAAMAKLYGTTYLSSNYGLLFTASAPAGVIAATLTTTLLKLIGWFPMFCICGSTYILSAMLSHFFVAKTPDGREI